MDGEEDTLKRAIELAEKYGFCVFPLYGIITMPDGNKFCGCRNPSCPPKSWGKHPAISKGLNAASNNPQVIENLWAARTGMNIGITTGVESGIFVVDIDGVLGEENMKKLESEHGFTLPPTLEVETSRGRHLFFKYPDRKVFSRNGVIAENVDIKGQGGYVVAPGSMHASGKKYAFKNSLPITDAQPKLLDLVCSSARAQKLNPELLNSATEIEWDSSEVRNMLDYLNPSCKRDEWVRVGMALKDGGYSFSLFEDWSRRSKEKYVSREDVEKTWNSFNKDGITMGTLISMAQLNGWKPMGYLDDSHNLESHPAAELIKKIVSGHEEKKKPEDNIDLTDIDHPVIGDTIRWICDTTVQPQPELALLNVLAMLSAIFCRYYKSPSGIRTNLYALGICGTSRGKDHSRTKIIELVYAAGFGQFLSGESIRSAPGVIATLNTQISCLMMIDEFGKFLQQVYRGGQNNHKSEVGDVMLALYGKSRSIYTAGRYASDKSDPIVLHNPGLCIYGTSTQTSYADAMKRSAISGGDMNRFVVMPGREDPPLRFDRKIPQDVPDRLLPQWERLHQLGNLEDVNMNMPVSEVATVGGKCWDENFERMFRFQQKMVQGEGYTADLWGRYTENSIKIAMIFAICRNPASPEFIDNDFRIAEFIVRKSILYMIDLATEFMYESEHEKDKKDVLRMIKKHGADGASKRDIMRSFQKIKAKDMDDILKALIESEMLEANKETCGGRPKIIYRSA